MSGTKCSYCGSLNGGHTLACSSLDREWDGDEGERRQVKHYLGERRHQVPLNDAEQRHVNEQRAAREKQGGGDAA